jgi:hypothetical protein
MRQIYEYHPVVGFRFVPGISSRVQHESGGYLVKTNSTGFRSPHEFLSAPMPGKKRVLLFGDSFTAGEGVSNGYRYGDFLESMVTDLEVYNFGLPATGPDQHYLIYREFARDIVHDLLVIAVFVENIRRVASRYRYYLNDAGQTVLYAKPYYTLDDGRLTLHGVPPPKQPIDEASLPPEARGAIAKTARFPKLKNSLNTLTRNPRLRSLLVDSGLKETLQRWSGYQPIPEYKDEQGTAWQTNLTREGHEAVARSLAPAIQEALGGTR